MSTDPMVTLNKAVREGIQICKTELNYSPTYFVRMLTELGTVSAIQRLVRSDPSEGFARLWEADRLDLSAEYIALWPEFETLFDEEDRNLARARLEQHEFCPWPRESPHLWP
jgi:hypothetical protein